MNANAADPSAFEHATALVIGEAGVLVRGHSGAGKSALARALIDRARCRNHFARLVGDDRISLTACGRKLVARGHPAISGLIEARGLGVLAIAWEAAAVIACAITLQQGEMPRLPEASNQSIAACGILMPHLALPADRPISDNMLDAWEFVLRLRGRAIDFAA